MEYQDYLKHYGILGMKWGQRNGPPYPLSSRQMNSSERKFNPQRRASDMSDEELDTTLKRLRKEDEYNRLINNNYGNKESDVKKMVKKALIGAAIAGGTLFIANASKDIGSAGYLFVKNFLKEYGADAISMLRNENYNLLDHLQD